MNAITLQHYLVFSALLFAVGLAGVVTRRNAIVVLMGIELMLSAGNLNFVAFWRFGPHAETLSGLLFVLFSIGIAAAESAVGLALIILIYRNFRTTRIDEFKELKG
jgi:NADH:ubiquinone oxidoreductase subunit K